MSINVPSPGILSMHYTKQEYPAYGTGDYRSPALAILQENGSRIVNFVYTSYEVYSGKKKLAGLPSTYVDDESEAETIEIKMHDDVIDSDMYLVYTIYKDYPVITRNTRIVNNGMQDIRLEEVLSTCVEFGDMDYEMVQLSGGWARERYVKDRHLEMGIQAIQGISGTCSSAEQNPFIALKRPDTTENQGEVYGFSLVYSGNFLAQVEVSTFDLTRVMLGISPIDFEWDLRTKEIFQTPEAVMVFSDKGLNGMSQVFHRLYRNRLMRKPWRDRERPILLNNWEATYFDFNEEKILKIAKRAKDAGVELFVLDDGWFGARNDDYHGLGDWCANLNKLPSGISGLSSKIEAMGLKFGLWVELEMVNKDSDLYRKHPDWVIGVPDRFESHARHQYVLDYSRREVVHYIYKMITKVLDNSSVSYIKWDMNRYMTEPYSRALPAKSQGRVMLSYMLGVYDLYDKLTKRYPEILFESCASGGARFDPGMMYYAPQTWCSDDTDAAERVKIQYGTSYAYPVVSMGAHVSKVPNEQLHRITPLETRANVAFFGTFGYELDLNLLNEDEFNAVKKQIEFMKKYRRLIQIDGDFYRLKSPFEGNDAEWEIVSADKNEAVAMFYQRLNRVNGSWLRYKLYGLDEHRLYHVECRNTEKLQAKNIAHGKPYDAYGNELMNIGIPISRELLNELGGDFASALFVISAV
jgi:alpha-galactosidase